MTKNLIVGFGPVGKHTAEVLHCDNIYDIAIDKNKPVGTFDCVFICTPTDVAIAAAREWKDYCREVIIRSTLSITDALVAAKEGFTLWPEFDVTETNNPGSPIIVFTRGSRFLRDILLEVLPMSTQFNIVSHIEAALAKLSDNYMLCTIVETVNRLHRICEKYDIEWDNVRNILLQDSRFPRSHSQFVSHEIRSACFALAKGLVDKE